MLEIDSLMPYLIERKLVDPAEVVDGALTIEAVTRRNENFKIVRSGGRGYFLKQASPVAFGSAYTLGTEAAVYSLMQRDSRREKLRGLLPTFYQYEQSENLLLLELIPEARPLWELIGNLNIAGRLGALLGRALGLVHSCCDANELVDDPAARTLNRAPPRVLWAHKPGPELLATLNPGTARLLGILKEHPELGRRMDELRHGWRCDALIHGDIKADNILVIEERQSALRVALIDWEFAHLGDPAWDVGSALADIIREWIYTMPATRGLSPNQIATAASIPLRSVQRFSQGLWNEYIQMADLRLKSDLHLKSRCLRWCGARLIQTACEDAESSLVLTNHAVLLLQVAANVLASPQSAAENLLALGGAA